MTTRYIGSVDYTAVAAWSANHSYAPNSIVRQVSPASGSERCFQTTAGGTSGSVEPTWVLTAGSQSPTDGTITIGTTGWVEVTGASWSAPHARLVNAIAPGWSGPGDDYNIHSNSAETQSTPMNLAFPGTGASPNRVFSCDTNSSPALQSDIVFGASVTTTGTTTMIISGFVYFSNMIFNVGTGLVAVFFTIAQTSSEVIFDSCSIRMPVTGDKCFIQIGTTSATTSSRVKLINTPIIYSGFPGCGFVLTSGYLEWYNTLNAVTGNNLTEVVNAHSRMSYIKFEGVDLTGIGPTKVLFPSPAMPTIVQVINCRLTAGTQLVSAPPQVPAAIYELINCDSGPTNFRNERWAYQGTLTTETTIVNAASDGGTPFSWKVVTTPNSHKQSPFECFPLLQWINTVNVPRTATFQVLTDTSVDIGSLTNIDIFVEAQVLDNAGYPISSLYTSFPGALTLPTILSAGSWAATGAMANPDPRSLQISFTNQMKGFVRFKIFVARASLTTLRIDPNVVIS